MRPRGPRDEDQHQNTCEDKGGAHAAQAAAFERLALEDPVKSRLNVA